MRGALYLRCIEARYLPGKNATNGYSDPYVKLKLNGIVLKTTIVPKCLHPVWGEDFTIPVNGETLSLSIWDANRFAQDSIIGCCEINLRSVEQQGNLTSWYALTDTKGQALAGAAILLAMVFETDGVLQNYQYANHVLDRAVAEYVLAEEKQELSALSLQMVTWNVGNHAPAEDLSDAVPKTRSFDIVAVGLQESRYQAEGSDVLWLEALAKHLGSDYFQVGAQNLWEIGLYVFAHKKHFASIHSVEKKVESTGVGRVMGNKGGVVISFFHNDLSLCFVTSHLAAQMTKCARRNRDVAEIIGGTKMGFKAQTDILNQYHHVFWMGDLNYRIDYGNQDTDSPTPAIFSEVVNMINTNQLAKLFAYDQLTRERKLGNVFAGFQEGSMVHIPPTFKVKRQNGFVYHPQRCPAWPDRILWKSLETMTAPRQVFLDTAPLVSTSDHKPVMSVFELSPFSAPMGFDSSVGECAIIITSLEGKDLLPADVNGFSDPYICFFSSFTESAKTAVIKKNLNPVWKSSELPAILSFANSRLKLRSAFIKVVAFDEDLTSADDEIGYGVLYLTALSHAKSNVDVSFSVQLTREGLPAGSLTGTFQLQFKAVGEKIARPRSLLTPSPKAQSTSPTSPSKLPPVFSRLTLAKNNSAPPAVR